MKEYMQNIKEQVSVTPEQQGELEQRLHRASKENRIHCSNALAIAKSLGVPPGEVGKTANKLKIRISKCQLGCF
jgi:LAO/AO transport system kinase